MVTDKPKNRGNDGDFADKTAESDEDVGRKADEVLRRMLKTPPKPHKGKKNDAEEASSKR